MSLFLANPAGFWALLALPVVVLIHVLQQKARRRPVSTLFLIEKLAPLSEGGLRVERLRQSVPFWLQILAVLLLTWLLVEPRWLVDESSQRVVILLDSSASMGAFRDEAVAALRARAPEWERAAARTEWRLMETDPAAPVRYSGTDRGEMLAALERWQPTLGTHDMEPALRLAAQLPGTGGRAVFVTDHPAAVPAGVDLLAVGSPKPNVGFAGFRVDTSGGEPQWQALLRNTGPGEQTRAWSLRVGGQEVSRDTVTLAPGEARLLRGPFPPEADALELVLEGDALAIDDRLPIVRPQPKQLGVAAETGSPAAPFFERVRASLDNAAPVPAASADLRLASVDPFEGETVPAPAVVVVRDTTEVTQALRGPIVAEPRPLMEGLNWQGLIAHDSLPIPPEDGDEVLLWQGRRPLVFLRQTPDGPLLFFNFDPAKSNAARLPATILLIHRFANLLRANKPAPATGNVDAGQAVALVPLPGDAALAWQGLDTAPDGPRANAPARPGFFSATQGDVTLWRGAAQFADTREADLTTAASAESAGTDSHELALTNSRRDPFAPLWILALGAVVAFSWLWQAGMLGTARRDAP